MDIFEFYPKYNIVSLNDELFEALTYNRQICQRLNTLNNLSVVLFNTNKNCYHQKMMTENGFECINSCTVDNFDESKSVLKLDYIYESLKSVTNKYSLILLNKNAFIVTLDDILEKYRQIGKKVLFASQRQVCGTLNFTTEEVQTFRKFNTDYCIGETESLLFVFEKLSKARQILSIEHYMEIHKNDFTNTAMNGFTRSLIDDINQSIDDANFIGMDYNELIFKDYSEL